MQVQSQPGTDIRIMILADSEAMVTPTTTIVRSVTGDDARLFVVPFACGLVDGKPFALDFRELAAGAAPVELLSPMGDGGGEPEGVAELAIKRDIDVIVVATTCDPEGIVHDPCGAAQLALDSPIPVMVLHRDETAADPFPPVRRIVVPLDGSSRAAQSLPFVMRAARRLRVPVRLVMAIDPTRVLPPAYAYDPDAMDSALNDLRETAHWALKQAEGWMQREGATVESVLLYGPVLTCVRSAIEDGDMVVMTTHGTGRAAPNRMGSVAEHLLHTVTNPLVIIRSIAPGDVVVEGYTACPWVEPLTGRNAVTAMPVHA